jgi:hypothetical protein
MNTSLREDTTLEVPPLQSLISSHHTDSIIVHQSESSQVPTNLSFIALTDKLTMLFFESELMYMGQRQKCRDMSGLSLCLCGDSTRPDDAGSI